MKNALQQTFSSREFNHGTGKAKKAAVSGPVFITDRGKPSFVLLSIDEYRRVTGSGKSLYDAVYWPDAAHIELEIPERRIEASREIDFF